MGRINYYTVYSNKTDEIVAFGTAEECTKQLGLASIDSFYCLMSRNRSGKLHKYTVLVDLIKDTSYLDDDNEDDLILPGKKG